MGRGYGVPMTVYVDVGEMGGRGGSNNNDGKDGGHLGHVLDGGALASDHDPGRGRGNQQPHREVLIAVGRCATRRQ